MYILFPLFLIFIFAILNRARGTQFFTLAESTAFGRLLATLFMGIAVATLKMGDTDAMLEITGWTWTALMFWCVWAWDTYWGMAICTTTPPRSAFAPVDWIMEIIWPHTPTPGTFAARIWGLIAMCLRQSLAAPWIIGLAYLTGQPEHALYSLAAPTLGAWYFIFGYLAPTRAVQFAEYAVGASLGLIAILTVGV